MIRQASSGYVEALHRRPAVLADGSGLPGLWHRLDVDPPEHRELHPERSVLAFVNDGRWIVACPCGGAQLANRRVDRFFCLDCAGERHDELWLRVIFPPDADRIEALLARRPRDKQRWDPGDSIEQLAAENDIFGVS